MFYLLHGEDEFSRSETLAKLKGRMGDPTMADLNTTVFDGRKASLGELMHACDAVPFLAGRRLVIVEGLLSHLEVRRGKGDKMEGGRPAWKKEYLEGLVDYLKRLPETTRLIFVEDTPVHPDNPIYQLALAEKKRKRAYVKEFRPPKGNELERWVGERTVSKGGQITPTAVKALVTFVGDDLRLLNQEIEKLLTYVDRARPITEEDVQLLVSYVQEANIFEMIDALGQRNGQRALKLLHKLLEDGNPPLALLGMIVRQFRIMLQIKELEGKGMSRAEIGRRLKDLHKYVIQKGSRQARNFSMEQLERVYDKLLETDWAIKTGRMDPVVALDMLVVGLSGGGKRD